MTEHNTYTPAWPITPAPKKQAWWKKPAVFIPVTVAVVAFALGSGTAGTKTETVEVTKEVQVPGPERVVTKEVKVNVPTVPSSCLEALTLNEQAFDIASESLGYVSKGQFAAANASTSKLNALAPKVNAAKAACRAAK